MNNKENNYLIKLIDLIYEKHQNLLPFLDVFRNDIETIKFIDSDSDMTAMIKLHDKRFEIIFNLRFIREYDLNDEDILWVICHEISHYVLEHLTSNINHKYSKSFCDIAFDCQVNSLLYIINERRDIDVLLKTNKINYTQFLHGEDPNGYYFLLVPPFLKENKVREDFQKINLNEKKRERIIDFWYKNYSENPLGLSEICGYLEKIIEDNNPTEEIIPEGNNQEIPESLVNLSEVFKNYKSENSLASEEIEDSNDSDRFDLSDTKIDERKKQRLKEAIAQAVFNNKKNVKQGVYSIMMRSIIPSINRREAVMLSNGLIPSFYGTEFDVSIPESVAIYIDFSASTQPYHKTICKHIAELRGLYKGPYFAFSEQVEEISYEDLLAGNFDVADTDIGPVIQHINKNKFQKALIITDGEFQAATIKTKAEIFVITFKKENNIDSLRKSCRIQREWVLEN